MASAQLTMEDLIAENRQLSARLHTAEETIRAIQGNEVDAFVLDQAGSQRVCALAGADESYRTFVEAMGQGALTVAGDGTILYCNRYFAQLVKCPLEKTLGGTIYDYVAPENEGLLRALLWEAMTSSSIARQFSLRTCNGSDFSAALTAAPITVAGIVSVCVLVDDLTEREARVAAEAANTAKDRFLALLSHELRTPLTPIALSINQLESHPDMPADALEDIAMVRRNIELELRLIDDLLDLSRVTSGKLRLQRQHISAHGLVRNVAEMLNADFLERNLKLHLVLEAPRDTIDADPTRLQQVLWNLVKNAIKFSNENAAITLYTYNQGGDTLVIEVRDQGAGIDPELMPRIFTAFEQGTLSTSRRMGGLGLGLAIAKTLVESHGGKIWAHSEGPGQGSTFSLALPLVQQNP